MEASLIFEVFDMVNLCPLLIHFVARFVFNPNVVIEFYFIELEHLLRLPENLEQEEPTYDFCDDTLIYG